MKGCLLVLTHAVIELHPHGEVWREETRLELPRAKNMCKIPIEIHVSFASTVCIPCPFLATLSLTVCAFNAAQVRIGVLEADVI